MKKNYKITINAEYSVEAENEDEAYVELEERFASENMTAENEFWDNCEIEQEDELKELIEDKLRKDEKAKI